MKRLDMVIRIEFPVFTLVDDEKEEFPIIKETILDNLANSDITRDLESSAMYMTSLETGKATDPNGDACEMQELLCGTNWKKLKIKVERVSKKKKRKV